MLHNAAKAMPKNPSDDQLQAGRLKMKPARYAGEHQAPA
jgi:hypothetical protein